MINTLSLLPFLIFAPLIASLLCFLFKNKGSVILINITSHSVLIAMAVCLYIDQENIAQHVYMLASWSPPLGIGLTLDSATVILVLLTSVLTFFYSVYSFIYFKNNPKQPLFWPIWWFLIAGIFALFVSNDAFNVYVALEMIGLSAVALVAFDGTINALKAALRYLFVGLVGSLFYLMGVAILYRTYGTLDFNQLPTLIDTNPAATLALLFITSGLVLKTAIAPLHFWLPDAHGSAPAPVSAMLSALVVKCSFYLIAMYWLHILPEHAPKAGYYFLGLLGVVSILWGSWRAFRVERLKHLIAYSTVAQLGYLFLLFPLAIQQINTTALYGSTFTASMYLVLAHAFAKSALFLAAGDIIHQYGHDNLSKLSGLVKTSAVSTFTFAIAGASLIGLPPSGGFIAKWLLLSEALEAQMWLLVCVILLGGLMASAYIFKVLNIAFSTPPLDTANKIVHKTVHKQSAMAWIALILACCAMALGFNAQSIMAPLMAPPSIVDTPFLPLSTLGAYS